MNEDTRKGEIAETMQNPFSGEFSVEDVKTELLRRSKGCFSILVLRKEADFLTCGSESGIRQMLHEGADLLFAGRFGAGHATRDLFLKHVRPDLGEKGSAEGVSGLKAVIPQEWHGGVSRLKVNVGTGVAKSQCTTVATV